MINDWNLPDLQMLKYIDDTTVAEVIPKNCRSAFQTGVNQLEDWTVLNKLQLQIPKCKELLFQFKRVRSAFPSVVLCSGILELAKVLGLTISIDLKWSTHVADNIKKANKRKYFIIQHKSAYQRNNSFLLYLCKASTRVQL